MTWKRNFERKMPRCLVTGVLVAVSIANAARSKPVASRESARKPNLIFILADDLGYAELGCYGQKKIRTPNLDRLASEGMRFTQFYSGNAVCAPSRCCLMTGKHPGHAYIRNNKAVPPEGQEPMPASEITIAELLKAQGYATACIGKWGLGPPGSESDPNRQGFDLFFGYNCQSHAHSHYPTYLRRNNERITLDGNDGKTGKQFSHDLMEAEALRFIRENKERPFFLYVPFTIPHVALQVPEDSLTEYVGKWDDPPYEGGKGYLPHPHPRAAFAAMVTRMDRSVGRIVALLKELDLERDTLVIFSSDNGPTHDRVGGSDSYFFESAGPLRGLKGSLYEGGIRVPFIARWPGRIKAGRVSDVPLAFWDVLPTLCSVAGVEHPINVDGISFAPTLFERGKERQHDFLYWEFPGYGGQQALRLGDWKAVRQNLNPSARLGTSRGQTQIELYNLANDIGEKNDLASQHPEMVERMRKIMAENHVPSPVFPIKVLDEAKQ